MALFTILVLVSGNSVRIMEGLTLPDSLVGALVLTSVSETREEGRLQSFLLIQTFHQKREPHPFKIHVEFFIRQVWMECMGQDALEHLGPRSAFGVEETSSETSTRG